MSAIPKAAGVELSDLGRSALEYASHGWTVFPVNSMKGKVCTCGDPVCRHPAKHPLTASGFQPATTDPETIEAWWRRWPFANIGLHVGGAGLLVLDLDLKKDINGVETLKSWSEKQGPLPRTPRSRTGGGGLHVFLRDPGGISPRTNVLPGVDVRSGGSYVILPPSIHSSGNLYRWEVAPW